VSTNLTKQICRRFPGGISRKIQYICIALACYACNVPNPGTQFYDWKPKRTIDILHTVFQEDGINSRRFPGFPGPGYMILCNAYYHDVKIYTHSSCISIILICRLSRVPLGWLTDQSQVFAFRARQALPLNGNEMECNNLAISDTQQVVGLSL